MAYDIFHNYNFDDCSNPDSCWKFVKTKQVVDSDGFTTDYTWYTNGDKHIFMFGDSDVYEPDEDYADWVAETEEEASEWFNSYCGFECDPEDVDFDEEDIYEASTSISNRNFMNEGFNRAYSEGLQLED